MNYVAAFALVVGISILSPLAALMILFVVFADELADGDDSSLCDCGGH